MIDAKEPGLAGRTVGLVELGQRGPRRVVETQRFTQLSAMGTGRLFRVHEGKIAEHWDTIETIPPREQWKNQNGKF